MLQTQTEKLLTAKAVGDMLSLSKRQIFRLKSCGLICSCIKVGSGAIRWKLSDVEKWISWNCPDRKEFEARKEAEKNND